MKKIGQPDKTLKIVEEILDLDKKFENNRVWD